MSALCQQTPEWLELRKTKIGASDSPIIMQVSPWKTPYQLWLEKMGKHKSEDIKSPNMKRGIILEEKARERFMDMTGLFVLPSVEFHKENEFMMASLDGIDIEKENIVEIKCPNADDHFAAVGNMVPEKYFPQLQHQLEVCQLDMAYYFSFDGNDGVIVKVYRDDKYIKNMVQKEKEFWECMQNKIPPELIERDYIKRNDSQWQEAASKWSSTHTLLKKLEIQEKEQRERLISLSMNKNSIGGGIKLSKIIRKGSVDYSEIPELIGVDLEKHRKKPTESWRITEE